MTTITELQRRVGEVNKANGWRETEYESLPTPLWAKLQISTLALITTEVSEAIEEIRDGREVDETYYVLGNVNYVRSGEAQYTSTNRIAGDQVTTDFGGKIPKPEGVPSELADVVIRALDFADAWDIDLEAAVLEKLAYNETRGYRHGGKTA